MADTFHPGGFDRCVMIGARCDRPDLGRAARRMAMRRGHLAAREPDGRAARIGDEYGPLTVRPIRWRLDLFGIAVTIKPEPAHGSRQEVPS